MRVWVSSESKILTAALVQFISLLEFEAYAEPTPSTEVALWHLSEPSPPYPVPPTVPTLVLTSGRADAAQLLKRGYRGHLDTHASAENLERALKAVHRGEIWANREVVAQALEDLTRPKITSRESEILACIAEGLPNRAIAIKLGITERTVKSHVSNLFEKYRVKSRVELALHVPSR